MKKLKITNGQVIKQNQSLIHKDGTLYKSESYILITDEVNQVIRVIETYDGSHTQDLCKNFFYPIDINYLVGKITARCYGRQGKYYLYTAEEIENLAHDMFKLTI